jgi:hypothetical protein
MAQAHGEAELLISQWVWRDREWGLEQAVTPKNKPPVSYFLQLGPRSFHHFTIMS